MANERSLSVPEGIPPRPPAPPHRPAGTRDALLDAALDRFSTCGYGGTSIRDLARDVGIRESSVYKHFPSKQAIFDALIERADEAFTQLAAGLDADPSDAISAQERYARITATELEHLAVAMLDAVAAEPHIRNLIGILTLEQFRDPAVGSRLRGYILDGPIEFQSRVFTHLRDNGMLRDGLDPVDAARAFWSPIACLLLTSQFDDDARATVRAHVHHFSHTHMKEPS